MFGISASGKEALSKIIEDIFDNIALQLIGDIPSLKDKKRLVISANQNFGLPHLFVQSMRNRVPNEVEQDVLKSLLASSHGYIESLKRKTMSNLSERLDGLAREANMQDRKLDRQEIQEVIGDELGKAKSAMAAITESESTKLRNLGTIMNVSRMSASVGDEDPTVFFVVLKDNVTCKECIRLHLMPDGVTPRLWKLSELKHSYHKRGEDTASAFGLHPHCFTETTKLHTSDGLVSIKELFLSQKTPRVFVDGRIKNRKIGNNQYGAKIPGMTWLDRHGSGAMAFPATKIYDTGVQGCVKITLKNGFSISVSEEHEMWVDDDRNGMKVPANKLKLGDKIPIISGECGFGKDHFPELAELMGNLMGDGNIDDSTARWDFFGNDISYGEKLFLLAKKYSSKQSNYNDTMTVKPPDEKYHVERCSFNSSILKNIFINEFQLSKKPRRVPARLWGANKETACAFLRGLYAADGCAEKSPSVVLSQNDRVFLEEIQLLLSNFGLVASINAHGEECKSTIIYANGDAFETIRKACWRLNLSGWEQCTIFAKEIGMGVPIKQQRLLNFLIKTEGKTRHGSWRTSRIDSIEYIGKQQTYCLTEPMTNTVTANGLVTGQCRCTLTYLTKGFAFDRKGKLRYAEEGYDAYSKQE